MAIPPEGAGDRRVEAGALEAFVGDLFRAAGTSDDDATLIASYLLDEEADAAGLSVRAATESAA